MEQKKTPVNYLYFGITYFLLLLFAASSIYNKESLGGSKFFFFLYALGQVTLEIVLFIYIGYLLRRYAGKFFFALFIGGTFLMLILHLFDFLMDRVLDLSIWETLQVFVFDENLDNFLLLLEASGISLGIWLLFFTFLASLPLIGISIYRLCNKLPEKKPLLIRHTHFLQAFLCIPFALFIWDFSTSKVIHPDAYTAFLKSLPWKTTFLRPKNASYHLPGSIQMPMDENRFASLLERDQTTLEKKSNIYLFVVESLREDAITKEIAPNLNQFKNDFIHFDLALSNGNGTHLSWYSIFHSQFSLHWQKAKEKWRSGSPALQMLKKWGYQIRVYSSAQLEYYGMDKVLFGEKMNLIDHYQAFHHTPPLSAADSDREAIETLQKDITENPALQQGQVFIVFWDSTHFDYKWPKNWKPKFKPYAKELAYFKTFQGSNRIQKIKNRYWNAINYMDSLFGSFMTQLPNKEEAIVIFTGDHGEEFFEHGHLFHNSHLTHQQTNVPLYMKFGQQNKIAQKALASQMDIFPSILGYLSDRQFLFLEGSSVFKENRWPYVVSSRFNAGRTPYEFAIQNGKNKLIVQFSNRKNISESNNLEIVSLRTFDDKTVHEFKNNIDSWVSTEFGSALERLFPKLQKD